MTQAVLLITSDASLAARAQRALPQPAMRRLELAVAAPGAPWVQRPWLLALLDGRAFAPAAAPEPAAGRGRGIPVLWLGEPPLLTAGLPPGSCLPGPVVDFLDRGLPSSALAFILEQHVSAAYLRALHTAPPPVAAAQHFRADLNNALTGLLGNAQLAAAQGAQGRRLPPVLTQRLRCIAELADQVRGLLAAQASQEQII